MMRDRQAQRGVALIELALILPVLLIMSFMVIEFGRAIYQYGVLVKSARHAARYLSTQTPNTKVTEAKNLVVYGTTTRGATPLVPGLTTAMVSASWPPPAGTNPPINTVTVNVSGFSFQTMVPGAFGLPFNNITFSDIRATMRSPTS